MPIRNNLFRYLGIAALVVAVMLVMAYGVVLIRSREALATAKTLASSSDFDGAIESYKDAISWRAPFNPYSSAARVELLKLISDSSISSSLKEKGLQYFAWAITRSRNVFTEADTIDALQKIDEIRAQNKLTIPQSQVRETAPPTLNFKMQIVADLFFWSWIVLVFISIWSGFNADGGIKPRNLAGALILSLVFYAGWLISLCFA